MITTHLGKWHRRLYKTRYYAKYAYLNFLPFEMIAKSLDEIISQYKMLPQECQKQIAKRVDYYNKLSVSAQISQNLAFVGKFKNNHASAYYYDIAQWLRYFPKNTPFSYLFGDISTVPAEPTLLKSRPIVQNNQNSVILKLDSVRHFYTLKDRQSFADKKPMLLWRGAAHQPHRLAFLEKFANHPQCDVKCVHKKSIGKAYHGDFMSIKEQLKYKFILSIEGNEVATNTKWIMASQSLCFMTTPRFETWLMEGLLKPEIHFVHLQDDYSDLDEKISFYTTHEDAAQKIITNANRWMSQFFDEKQELITSVLVMKKYFEYTMKNI